MAYIHFFFNSKGGTGKSHICNIVAQYLMSKGFQTHCIDCDPVTPTLVTYKTLHASHVQIMFDNEIVPTKFDSIMETIAAANPDDHILIDNGTSSFVALGKYMLSNGVVDLLQELGNVVIFHFIIVGGDNMETTTRGMTKLLSQFNNTFVKNIVWLNPFFGPIIDDNGKGFQDFNVYERHKSQIFAIVNYPHFPPETFGKSISQLQKDGRTFSDVLDSETPPYELMTRQRIKMMRNKLFSILDATLVF